MTTIEKQQELMDILADKKKIQFKVFTQKPAIQTDEYVLQIDPEDIVMYEDNSGIDVDETFKKAGINSAEDLQSQAQYLSMGIEKAKNLVAKGIDAETYIAGYKKALVLGGDSDFDEDWDGDQTTTYQDTYEFGPSEKEEYRSKIEQFRAYFTAEKKLKKSS